MYRHIRQSCKIANSEEGMEKLLDHTLQRQMAQMRAQMAELTTLMKGQLTLAAPATQQIAQPIQHAGQVNNGAVTNNNTVVHIHPWDGDRRIGVELAHILAAFTDNAKLREYARMGDHELTDPAIAPPYVTELLMDLTRRAHADPAARNVYLNPRRADQALVHKKTGTWEVLPLAEATRLIFDGDIDLTQEPPYARAIAANYPLASVAREVVNVLPNEDGGGNIANALNTVSLGMVDAVQLRIRLRGPLGEVNGQPVKLEQKVKLIFSTKDIGKDVGKTVEGIGQAVGDLFGKKKKKGSNP